MCSSSVDKHNDTKLSKFSWRLTSLFSIASYPRSMYYDQGTRITLQSMVNELSFRWNCVEEFKGFNSLHGVLHCRYQSCNQFNRIYAPMGTQTSTSCQAFFSPTTFCFATNWKEMREPCTVNLCFQIRNCSVKNTIFCCIFCDVFVYLFIFVEWPVKPLIRVIVANETKFNKFG